MYNMYDMYDTYYRIPIRGKLHANGINGQVRMEKRQFDWLLAICHPPSPIHLCCPTCTVKGNT